MSTSAKRRAQTAPSSRATKPDKSRSAPQSKLDRMVSALRTPKGATITDLAKITGWQVHSVRGALSGALKKKRGLAVTSTKTDGARVYRIAGRG